jgi:hypothetical protein
MGGVCSAAAATSVERPAKGGASTPGYPDSGGYIPTPEVIHNSQLHTTLLAQVTPDFRVWVGHSPQIFPFYWMSRQSLAESAPSLNVTVCLNIHTHCTATVSSQMSITTAHREDLLVRGAVANLFSAWTTKRVYCSLEKLLIQI